MPLISLVGHLNLLVTCMTDPYIITIYQKIATVAYDS